MSLLSRESVLTLSKYLTQAEDVRTIYIAGPISTRDSACPRATRERYIATAVEATFECQRKGWAVYCPHALAGYGHELDWWSAYDVVMPKDLALLARMDAVLFLLGWEQSRGACMEHVAAKQLGKTIYYSITEVPSV